MVDKKTIEEILNIAVHAPSGNNSQPWRFEVSSNNIFIFNLPNADKFLFNYEQRGSYIAHGALIENILITALEKGYNGKVMLFPKKEEKDLVAEITLEKSQSTYEYHHLYPFIVRRTTNRKPFKKIPLNKKDEESIVLFLQSLKKFNIEILLTQDVNSIGKLSKYFSVADRLIFENADIHKAFFAKVSWTREEEKKRGEGLYVGTKELSPLMKFIFKNIFSNWNFLKVLSNMRISEKAAKKRENLYKNCSAIGLVISDGDSPEDFIYTGRALQLFWLNITSLGLSFQPVSAGLLYIGQRIQKETPVEFSQHQIQFISQAYQSILTIFDHLKKIPAFSFRIGYSDPPTASSMKRAPEITWL